MKQVLMLLILNLAWFGGLHSALAQNISADSVTEIKDYRNAVYAELGGNGIIGSVNYERLFLNPKPGEGVAVRVGGFFLPNGIQNGRLDFLMMVPLEVTYITGEKDLKLEVGGGITWFAQTQYYQFDADIQRRLSISPMPVFRIGGRWMPADKAYFLRFGFTPVVLIFTDVFLPVLPWVGVSYGYHLGR